MKIKLLAISSLVIFGLNIAMAEENLSEEYVNQMENIDLTLKENDVLITKTCEHIDDLELAYYQANKDRPDIAQKIQKYGELKVFCSNFLKYKEQGLADAQEK